MRVRAVKVTPLRQNCTVLDDPQTGHAVVIDPGNAAEVLPLLQGLHVDSILLTHGHLDHAGGARTLKRILSERQGENVAVIGPDKRDLFLLESVMDQARSFGIMDMDNITPDRFTQDGETLELLGRTFEVALVPGHTPGHVVFIDRTGGLALVGDTLFRGVVGRTDFAYGDHGALIAAIRDKLLTLPDETVVLPGHGLPTTIGEERASNPFLL